MKVSIRGRQVVVSMFLLLIVTACTSAEQAGFQMPTLAVLPSVTPPPDTPAFTSSPVPIVPPTAVSSPTNPPPTVSPVPTCDIPAWWETIQPTVVRFFDTWSVATMTARASLSPVLLDLREIWREFEAMDYPECAEAPRNEIVAAMADTADGFNEFLAQRDTSNAILQRAAFRFYSAAQMLTSYEITADERMLTTINEWGGVPEAATLTQIYMSPADLATANAATSAVRATEIIQRATDAVLTLTPPNS